MLLSVIVACEIAFWVVLGAGLATRYLLRRRRLSTAMLVTVPLLDVVVLLVSAIDLKRGATAETAHGLAAAYIGFSVAFGPSLVRWADERFAHRFAAGPAPRRRRRHGRERTLHEWREFAKAVLAWTIACGLLLTAIAVADNADRTAALEAWLQRLTLVLAVWALWPITYTLWPSKPAR